eukprot:4537285-Amphidinium_carterae.1
MVAMVCGSLGFNVRVTSCCDVRNEGAIKMQEIFENIDNFSETLCLKPLASDAEPSEPSDQLRSLGKPSNHGIA